MVASQRPVEPAAALPGESESTERTHLAADVPGESESTERTHLAAEPDAEHDPIRRSGSCGVSGVARASSPCRGPIATGKMPVPRGGIPPVPPHEPTRLRTTPPTRVESSRTASSRASQVAIGGGGSRLGAGPSRLRGTIALFLYTGLGGRIRKADPIDREAMGNRRRRASMMIEHLIPATVIGSWSFPGWYEKFVGRRGRRAGAVRAGGS